MTVALDLLLIPFFGVTGAAVASLVAYLVFGVASFVTESRVSGLPIAKMLPTRADILVYPAAARRLWIRVIPNTPGETGP